MKAWGGRFAAEPDANAADFGRSIEVDAELALEDIAGSLAHVAGLLDAGLLTTQEAEAIGDGLRSIAADVRDGAIEWDPAHEDIHMNVEMELTLRVGPVAGKLHTGRSRNDQVATDLRLYLRRRIREIDASMVALERSLVGLAIEHRDAVMPGHTHVQPAQPVLFAHHLLAYVEMLERDRGRFADTLARASLSPLGSGALAGAGFKLDREATAEALGFSGVTHNSIDAVGDRDPVVEAISAAALAMAHLSRLAEEIVWWTNPNFGFVRPADAWSTGSSMMPNKRNPDPAELIRGRTARVAGHLVTALTMLKGIPAGYQRDLQEDKPPLVDALSTLESSLDVMAGMVATMQVDEARMLAAATAGYTTATAVADALVELGVPFREGHHIVGSLVARAEAAGVELTELPDRDIAEVLASSADPLAQRVASDPEVAGELRTAATLENALARPDVIGGTAPARVQAELDAAIERLSDAQ
jgi:argininosuccinate lyase